MLVLSRKIGETIRIGDNINVTLVEIVRGRIRLAVTAPREINIFRGELVKDERTDERTPRLKGGINR